MKKTRDKPEKRQRVGGSAGSGPIRLAVNTTELNWINAALPFSKGRSPAEEFFPFEGEPTLPYLEFTHLLDSEGEGRKHASIGIGEQLEMLMTELFSRAVATPPPLDFPDGEWMKEVPSFDDPELDGDHQPAIMLLAIIAREAPRILEALANREGTAELVKLIAARSPDWPVNLTLEKGKVRRLTFARKYLQKLGVGSQCSLSQVGVTGDEDTSPFNVAARRLLRRLIILKHSFRHFPPSRLSSWKRHLVALAEPMTKENVRQWWAVAKVWLDERWKMNKLEFKTLIDADKALDASQSEKKRNVISNNLKKAFLALAK